MTLPCWLTGNAIFSHHQTQAGDQYKWWSPEVQWMRSRGDLEFRMSDAQSAFRSSANNHGMNGRASGRKDVPTEVNGSQKGVAHTLTACTRCRQVRAGGRYEQSGRSYNVRSGKRNAIQASQSVWHARGRTPYANTLTRPKGISSIGSKSCLEGV
jgi:hypothetical protein